MSLFLFCWTWITKISLYEPFPFTYFLVCRSNCLESNFTVILILVFTLISSLALLNCCALMLTLSKWPTYWRSGPCWMKLSQSIVYLLHLCRGTCNLFFSSRAVCFSRNNSAVFCLFPKFSTLGPRHIGVRFRYHHVYLRVIVQRSR